MALTGAVAAAVRQFDPYPEFDNVRVFRGRPETGERPIYKTAGLIVPRFEMVPGVQIVGGAGFGQREINTAWRGARADEPLIGDGGLRNAEARPELVGLSCRPADALWTITGGTKAAGSTYKGIFRGAKAVSAGAVWNRLQVPSLTVTSGQLYTVIARYRAGTSGRANIELRNVAGAVSSSARGSIGALAVSATGAGPLSIIETVDEGDGVIRTVLSWTPSFTGGSEGSGIGPDSAVVGEDIEVLGLSIQAGAYVNNPPIDNGNLPATRTGYSYLETGRTIQPVHYGVARARWLALPAAHAAGQFPYVIDLRPADTGGRLTWLANPTGNAQAISLQGSGGTDAYIFFDNATVGTWKTVAWAVRAGQLAISVDGAALQTAALGGLPPVLSRVGSLCRATTAGLNIANAEMEGWLTRNGEISNDALQALAARFAA
jgi:hypothetical protein